MSALPIKLTDLGRLNIPRVAELARAGAIERLKCRWCGRWGERSTTGALECVVCDRAAKPLHPSTERTS